MSFYKKESEFKCNFQCIENGLHFLIHFRLIHFEFHFKTAKYRFLNKLINIRLDIND